MSHYTEREREAFKAGASWTASIIIFSWIAFEIFFGCALSKCEPRPVEYYTPSDFVRKEENEMIAVGNLKGDTSIWAFEELFKHLEKIRVGIGDDMGSCSYTVLFYSVRQAVLTAWAEWFSSQDYPEESNPIKTEIRFIFENFGSWYLTEKEKEKIFEQLKW